MSIDTAKIPSGSITITSEDNFNKVINSGTSTVILYKGLWTVVSTDWDLATIQSVFLGCSVSQDETTKVITIQIPESLA